MKYKNRIYNFTPFTYLSRGICVNMLMIGLYIVISSSGCSKSTETLPEQSQTPSSPSKNSSTPTPTTPPGSDAGSDADTGSDPGAGSDTDAEGDYTIEGKTIQELQKATTKLDASMTKLRTKKEKLTEQSLTGYTQNQQAQHYQKLGTLADKISEKMTKKLSLLAKIVELQGGSVD